MTRRLATVACLGLGLAWSLIGSGCVSKERLIEREREVEQLKRLSALQESNLTRTEDALASSREREQRLRSEQDELLQRHEEATRELAAKNALVQDLESQRGALSERADRAERALERERTRLKTVIASAAEQVEELTRLRAGTEEVAQKEAALRSANTSLKNENARIRGELEKSRSDLLAANAVIRSISAGESKAHEAQTALLQEKVRQLEEERRALVTERDELAQRVVSTEAEASDTPTLATSETPVVLAAAAAPTPSAAATSQGASAGPWQDFASLVRGRATQLVRGESAWDGVDVALAGAVVGTVLVALWALLAPLRWRRGSRRRRELRVLRARVEELESGSSRESASSRAAPRRGSTVIRRSSGFSPILAPVDERPVESPVAQEESCEDDEVEELTVQLGALEPVEDEDACEVESDASAQVWDDEEEEEDDEFANTQIIPSLSELEDLGSKPTPADRKPAPAERKPATQRDREFMDELKQMIGRKVDEMIQ